MNILVSGSSGFIGSHIVAELASQGQSVLALTRKVQGDANAAGIMEISWSFTETLPENKLGSLCYAIHLAHDFDGALGAERTVSGTLELITTCRKAGAKRQIFLSSLSAHAGAQSRYGQTKYKIEQSLANMPDVVIIRPGLVLGNGGLYGRISRWVKRFPIVPLPDGGRGKISVINISVLSRQMIFVLFADHVGDAYNLFEEMPKTLRELVLEEARAVGRKIFIIDLSANFLIALLSAFEACKIKLPVTSDNLQGFVANQTSETHQLTPWENA